MFRRATPCVVSCVAACNDKQLVGVPIAFGIGTRNEGMLCAHTFDMRWTGAERFNMSYVRKIRFFRPPLLLHVHLSFNHRHCYSRFVFLFFQRDWNNVTRFFWHVTEPFAWSELNWTTSGNGNNKRGSAWTAAGQKETIEMGEAFPGLLFFTALAFIHFCVCSYVKYTVRVRWRRCYCTEYGRFEVIEAIWFFFLACECE